MDISRYIDHTILKADTRNSDIVKVCKEAMDNHFYSVCINSCFVPQVKKLLDGSDVKITSVIGFPLGAMDSAAKAYEAKVALEHGADEIDMVMNISAMKDENYEYVLQDIKQVVDAINGRALLKVIIETALLSEDEKVRACKLSVEAGADFVKTSTGFSTSGATVEDIKLMRSIVGDKLGVKASGGIRTRELALQMIEAGASRLGTSASVSIVQGVDSKSSGY